MELKELPSQHPTLDPSDMSLRAIQIDVLHHALRGASFLVLALLLVSLYSRSIGLVDASLLPLLLACAIIWYITFAENRIPYWARAGTLLALSYVVGLVDIFNLGFSGDGRQWLLLAALAGFALFDKYVGTAMVVVTSLTVGITARFIDQGLPLLLDRNFAAGIQAGETWWFGWLTYILVTGLVLYSLTQFLWAARRQWQQESALAEQLTLERVQLEDQVSARYQALLTSTEISGELSSKLDQQELADSIVNRLQTAFQYDFVQLYFLSGAEEKLTLASGIGPEHAPLALTYHEISVHDGLIGQAARSRADMFVTDVTTLENGRLDSDGQAVGSELAVPVMLGSQCLGVLAVQQRRQDGLREDDVILVRSIANQLAIALQNARLYERARRRAEQGSLINESARRIQAADSLADVLAEAAQALGELLGETAVRVQLTSHSHRVATAPNTSRAEG